MALDVVSARVTGEIFWTVSKTIAGLGPRPSTGTMKKAIAFGVGVGANQINEVYSSVRTLAGAATETIDLSAALANVCGDLLITVARVKYWGLFVPKATEYFPDGTTLGGTGSGIIVGAAVSNPWTGVLNAAGTLTIPSGGFNIWGVDSAAGVLVGAGSNDQLLITNADAALATKYFIGFGFGAT